MPLWELPIYRGERLNVPLLASSFFYGRARGRSARFMGEFSAWLAQWRRAPKHGARETEPATEIDVEVARRSRAESYTAVNRGRNGGPREEETEDERGDSSSNWWNFRHSAVLTYDRRSYTTVFKIVSSLSSDIS